MVRFRSTGHLRPGIEILITSIVGSERVLLHGFGTFRRFKIERDVVGRLLHPRFKLQDARLERRTFFLKLGYNILQQVLLLLHQHLQILITPLEALNFCLLRPHLSLECQHLDTVV